MNQEKPTFTFGKHLSEVLDSSHRSELWNYAEIREMLPALDMLAKERQGYVCLTLAPDTLKALKESYMFWGPGVTNLMRWQLKKRKLTDKVKVKQRGHNFYFIWQPQRA